MSSKSPRTRGVEPLDQVVLATDFSEGAALAAQRAALLPLSRRAHLTLVHVLPRGLPRNARANAEELARRKLEATRDTLRVVLSAQGRGQVVQEVILAYGEPHAGVIRHAGSTGADLVVIGRHGARTVRDLFIGSTAARVVRASGAPVLLVNGPAKKPYRRPLVAVDLEGASASVVEIALRIAPTPSRLSLVHAYQVPFEGFLASAGLEGDYLAEQRSKASAQLSELVTSVRRIDARSEPQARLRRGDPRTVILFEAERLEADLLVVGTHRRSSLSRALLGSVAEWVVAVAKNDVLVARAAPRSDPWS